jgi:hypothetical protein
MTTSEIAALADRLPLSVPDLRDDYGICLDSLTSYSGRLHSAVQGLRVGNEGERTAAMHRLACSCGAIILVLVSITQKASINLEDAITEGSISLKSP